MKSFMKEFKEFISRGNVMDMAVGIIIGGAFTAIVTSLVEDIITPIIGMIGGFDFSSFVVTVNNSCDQLPADRVRPVQRDQGYEQGSGHRQEAGRGSGSHNKDVPLLQERDRDRSDQMPSLHIPAGCLIQTGVTS